MQFRTLDVNLQFERLDSDKAKWTVDIAPLAGLTAGKTRCICCPHSRAAGVARNLYADNRIWSGSFDHHRKGGSDRSYLDTACHARRLWAVRPWTRTVPKVGLQYDQGPSPKQWWTVRRKFKIRCVPFYCARRLFTGTRSCGRRWGCAHP